MPKTAKKSITIKKPLPVAAKPHGTSSLLEVGAKAPSFSLPIAGGQKVTSSGLKGKPYILYFYPKDDTSGCTLEACSFQDALPHLAKLGMTVVGVSKDSLESHEKFAKKYKLTFPLGSDMSGSVCEAFGVWKQKSMYGRTYMGIERSTFLVDSKGIIQGIWRKVSVPGHSAEVKMAFEQL